MSKQRIKISQLAPDNAPTAPALDDAMNATGFQSDNAVAKDGPDINQLLATDEAKIDGEVQSLVVNLNEIVKRMSIKFFDMEISDIESLSIVKELLKDIANRVAHLPVQDVVDKIDDILDNAEKIEKSKATPTPGNVGTGEQSTVPQVAQAI